LIPEEAIFCPECGGSAAPVQDSPSEGESPAPGRHEMPSEPTTEDPTAALVGSPSPSEPGVVAPWIGREGPPATEERLAAGMLCSVCGTEVPLEAGFCPECGTPVAPATEHFG
jgi:hypothetical protein